MEAAPAGLPGAPSVAPAPAADAAPKADAAPAKDAQKSVETPKQAEERWKLRGSKGEREYTRADLERKLQIADGADAEIRRARESAKAHEEWTETFKKKGLTAAREAAEKNGITDFDKQIEDYLIEKYQKANKPNDKGEWEPKSQQEIELEDLRQYKKTATERETKVQEETRAAKEQQEIAALSEQYAKEVRPILQKLGYDAKVQDALILPIVSDVMMAADAKGVSLTTDQAVAETRELIGDFFTAHMQGMAPDDFKATMSAAITSRFADAPASELVSLIGPENVKKILAHTVEQLRGGRPATRETVADDRPRAKRPSHAEEIEALRNMQVFGQRTQR